jgi:hypothetical protein
MVLKCPDFDVMPFTRGLINGDYVAFTEPEVGELEMEIRW